MANASAHKKLGPAWSNEEKYVELEYDFANDGGATGTISLADVDQKMIITQAIVHVETACTSGGAAVVTIGPSSADPDGFLDAASGAVASLVDDYTVIESTGPGLVVGATETIDLVIATAALTAGKIKVKMKYVNAV